MSNSKRSGFRARTTKFSRSGSPRTLIEEAINLAHRKFSVCIKKERKKDEEENERGSDRGRRLQAANPKSHFLRFCRLNQAVPNHLADESQTR